VVVKPVSGEAPAQDAAFVDDGVLIDSDAFTGQSSGEARRSIAAALEKQGKGKLAVTYRQRDWGFSRQRYWGTPIPILYCEKCDPEGHGTPVPESELPVRLPEIDVQAVLTGKGAPPLAKVESFVNTTCPSCKGPAKREVETMDTFVDSSWYQMRYLSPHFSGGPVQPEEAKRWAPVDVYVGGPEHAVMHLLYFRFWNRVMKEMGLVPTDEPATKLITQGIVNGADGRKMSKRWGNAISPSTIVERYGADTCRTYVLFAGPPERDFDWSDDQVEGAFRFLKRIWVLAATHHAHAANAKYDGPYEGNALEIRRAAHRCLKRIGEAIERLSYNTAIAGIMECLNSLTSVEKLTTPAEFAAMGEAVRILAAVLTPFAPHLADELGEAYGITEPVACTPWPTFDPALVVDDSITYAVQVNGKLRGEVQVPTDATEAVVRSAAEGLERVQASLTGKTLRKVIFVPKRLISFVVSDA
jgi:leucyl-tRNA synthetase